MAQSVAEKRKKLRAERAAKGGAGKGTSKIYNTLTPEEVQIRQRIFNTMKHSDRDTVDAADVVQSYGDLGMEVSMQSATQMLGGFQSITFPQFLNLLNGDSLPAKRSDLSAAFSCFDLDGSGTIPVDQLREILTSPKFENPIPEEIVQTLLDLAPKDSKGVDYEGVIDLIKLNTASKPE